MTENNASGQGTASPQEPTQTQWEAGMTAAGIGGMGQAMMASYEAAQMFTNMNIVVDGKESDPGAPGGKVEFDPDEARGVYQEFLQHWEHLDQLALKTDRARQIGTPAEVHMCTSFTQNDRTAFDAGHATTEQFRDMLQSLKDKLARVIDVNEEQEDQADKDVKKAGGEDSGEGYL
ncbi:hypothetical protein GCM10009676_19480 [Prauserella halophila]|uniref:PE family protein n=1 Tax=Prauserella halophila TaxID=185641 RepID=A0ABN1W808_9PSEU|nr:hypothetical protein [Prauserella halophila]MCP2235851.1 hypothetical protein [Prauserella halophila]